MSKYGDKFFGQILRQLAGLEPSTKPGRRCPRCQKDMSDYLLLPQLTPTDNCGECNEALRREDYRARMQAAKPPVYDILAILNAPGRKPYQLVGDFVRQIDQMCPETLLLEPELVVRDFSNLSCFLGHDLGYMIGRNPDTFLRALRAMKAIGATRMAQFMTEMRDFAVSQGIAFPDPIPDPWFCDIEISDELEDRLDEESRRLQEVIKPYDDATGSGYLDQMVVDYLRNHIDLLKTRNPADGGEPLQV